MFHPYLGISYLDMLKSDNIRAYCVGVTNSIFTQKYELTDAIVSVIGVTNCILYYITNSTR